MNLEKLTAKEARSISIDSGYSYILKNILQEISEAARKGNLEWNTIDYGFGDVIFTNPPEFWPTLQKNVLLELEKRGFKCGIVYSPSFDAHPFLRIKW